MRNLYFSLFIFLFTSFALQADLYTQEELKTIHDAQTFWNKKYKCAKVRSDKRCFCSIAFFTANNGKVYAKSAQTLLQKPKTLAEATKDFKTRQEWDEFYNKENRRDSSLYSVREDLIVDKKTELALRIILKKLETDYKNNFEKEKAVERCEETRPWLWIFLFSESSNMIINSFRMNERLQIHLIKKVLKNSEKVR